MDRRRVYNKDDLHVLNTVTTPTWIYSCATHKLVWANGAALQLFSRSLEQFTSFKFSTSLPSGQLSSYQAVNNLIKGEVEVGGKDHVLSGCEGTVLPGVIPHDQLVESDVLYKQLVLTQPDSSTMLCTQVQLLHKPPTCTLAGPKSTGLQSHSSPPSWPEQKKIASSIASLVEVFEALLDGRQVERTTVEQLHASLLRGDFVAQPTQLEEELVCKEELEEDVGLNLLQLLGGKKLGERYHPASNGGPGIDAATTSMESASSQLPQSSSRQGLAQLADEPQEEIKEMVAASLVPAMEAVLATVDNWRFDAFKLHEATAGHPLSALGFWLFKRYDLISTYQLDAAKLALFLRKIEDGYPDNPYHNKTHAADVLQSMHCILTHGGLARRIGEDLAFFASYLAALLHDFEHRGLNNDFLVRVSDDLAVTYNDASPMENHHVAAAFRLLKSNEYNFMKKLPREKAVRLRKLLIDLVLATDMKQHFNILSKFQARLQVKRSTYSSSASHDHQQEDTPPVVDDDADKSLILQVGLKCADVGHLAAPWEVHHRWVSCLEEEFFRQGDREKSLHMLVSPLMDRCKDGITKSQVGFFDIVALPMFYSLATVFPDCVPLVSAVEDNCNHWRHLEASKSGSK